MDYIHIKNLMVSGKHGVGKEERAREQVFEISLRLEVGSTKEAARSGRLMDTYDYQPLKEAIESIVSRHSYYLIETIAEKIADVALQNIRVQSVEVSIYKPQVWLRGMPGLTISRGRPIGS